MATTPEYIRQSELLDQLVLDRTTMDELGRVEVLWAYPKVHRVLGFICKSGPLGRRKTAFNLDQIATIGDSVLVGSKPVETDADRVRQLESLLGCEVWTDDGHRVGKISDYVFHLETGTIRQYLLTSGGLRGLAGTTYALYPSQILTLGRSRVMVSAGVVPGLEVYQAGLDQKIREELRQVGDTLREQKAPAQQEVRSLMSRAKSKAKTLAEQAQERLEALGERLEDPEFGRELGRELGREFSLGELGREAAPREESVEFDFDAPWDAPSPQDATGRPPASKAPPSQAPLSKSQPAPSQPPPSQPPQAQPPREQDAWDDEIW
jgi:uncharacterized protein YrrD